MERKPKLTIPEQVEYMENDCGIKFVLCTKEEAIEFLTNHTYFFKIKAFAKVFPKNKDGTKYHDLDFEYLKELSTLDMYFRKEILNVALDFEHYLKVWMIKDLSRRDEEDGYSIVEKFFAYNPDEREEINRKAKSSVCKDLTEALEEKGYAMWNVIEVLSFGSLIKLYNLYCETYNIKSDVKDLLMSIKCIRNAAAHNNCLLNSLRQPYSKEIKNTKVLAKYLDRIPGLSQKAKMRKMENPVSHDFAALLMGFDMIVSSDNAKKATYKRLNHLFNEVMPRNKTYFLNNEAICSHYEFGKKTVDFLYKSVYDILW